MPFLWRFFGKKTVKAGFLGTKAVHVSVQE